MSLVFARKLSDPLIALLQQLDRALAENKAADLRGWFVLLTPDRPVMEPRLDELAARHGLGALPLTIAENPQGPPNFRLHRDAEITVLLYRESKVVVNHAFRRGELNETRVAQVVRDLGKILPGN